MNLLLIILYSIIQGIAEFAPISSSGHLVLLHAFLPLQGVDELAFDVALHFGTTLALIIYFFKDFTNGFAASTKATLIEIAKAGIIFALPVGLVGYFGEGFIETNLRSPWIVALMLVIGSLLFFYIEKYKNQSAEGKIGIKEMFIAGIAQALSLIPGLSRSGITIVAFMFLGANRLQAAKLSFMYVIPLLLVISAKKGYDLAIVGSVDVSPFVVGIIFSCLAGLLTLHYLLKLLSKISLKGFAWYRIILAVLLVLLLA